MILHKTANLHKCAEQRSGVMKAKNKYEHSRSDQSEASALNRAAVVLRLWKRASNLIYEAKYEKEHKSYSIEQKSHRVKSLCQIRWMGVMITFEHQAFVELVYF